MAAKLFNVVVGTWLIVSAFAWPHAPHLFKATIACGLATIVLSIGSLFADRAPRLLIVVVAMALVGISAGQVGRRDPVLWNNVAVAFVTAATVSMGARREPAFLG